MRGLLINSLSYVANFRKPLLVPDVSLWYFFLLVVIDEVILSLSAGCVGMICMLFVMLYHHPFA